MPNYYKFDPKKQAAEFEKKSTVRKNFLMRDNVPNEAFLVYPDNNKITIRFLPPWSQEFLILKKVNVHSYVGPDAYTFGSPKAFGMYDPFAEVTRDIFGFGKDEWKNWKEDLALVNTTENYYANVMQSPQLDKVLIARFPRKLAIQLREILESEMWAGATDVESGRDFQITTSGAQKLRSYSVIPTPNQYSLLGNPGLDNLWDLDNIFIAPPVDILCKAFVSLDFPRYIVNDQIKRNLKQAYNFDYDLERAKLTMLPSDTAPSAGSQQSSETATTVAEEASVEGRTIEFAEPVTDSQAALDIQARIQATRAKMGK